MRIDILRLIVNLFAGWAVYGIGSPVVRCLLREPPAWSCGVRVRRYFFAAPGPLAAVEDFFFEEMPMRRKIATNVMEGEKQFFLRNPCTRTNYYPQSRHRI